MEDVAASGWGAGVGCWEGDEGGGALDGALAAEGECCAVVAG